METLFYVALLILLTMTLISKKGREKVLSRNASAWFIDLVSLATQFFVLPLAQIWVTKNFFADFFPSFEGSLSGSFLQSIALYAAIDYAWYWQHRGFHASSKLWRFHKVHHSAAQLDLLVTAKNSFVSHFVMVYFWMIGFLVFVLKDPSWFLAFATLGLFLNFWNHTDFHLPATRKLTKIVSLVFITPVDHFWHHSDENKACNFATTFSLWDRFHGTYFNPGHAPKKFGEDSDESLLRKLVYPA